MKSIFNLFCLDLLLLLNATTYSQETKRNYVGGFVAFGSEIEKFRLGGLGDFYFSDEVSFSSQLLYYFVGSSSSFSEINANINYHFSNTSQIDLYALGWLNLSNFTGSSNPFKRISSDVGINLGAGLQLNTDYDFIPFVELKYILASSEQAVLFFGVKFSI